MVSYIRKKKLSSDGTCHMFPVKVVFFQMYVSSENYNFFKYMKLLIMKPI